MLERDAYIALNMMQGVGPVTVRNLATAIGSVADIFSVPDASLSGVAGVSREIVRKIIEQRRTVDVAVEVEAAARTGATIITPVDEMYPRRLKEIYDPPQALYIQGGLENRDQHAVAIVGSRHTTHYGTMMAEKLAWQLAQNGITVVSGLARGIDTAAHRGALKGGGRTIAVLGGAIDRLYPPENAELAKEMASRGGAVISEFRLGREPDKTTFPMRNRIVSGLSLGVVVIEAGLTSGAMITAQQALEQGRAVMAVPGRVDMASSRGAHQLIKSGARLVEDVEDILEEFEQLLPRQASAGPGEKGEQMRLNGDEQNLVGILRNEGAMDVDQLIRRSGVAPAEMNTLLLALEMKRVLRLLPGRQVALRE